MVGQFLLKPRRGSTRDQVDREAGNHLGARHGHPVSASGTGGTRANCPKRLRRLSAPPAASADLLSASDRGIRRPNRARLEYEESGLGLRRLRRALARAGGVSGEVPDPLGGSRGPRVTQRPPGSHRVGAVIRLGSIRGAYRAPERHSHRDRPGPKGRKPSSAPSGDRGR